MKKKILSVLLLAAFTMGTMAGCGSGDGADGGDAAGWDAENEISVISREDGSGTRGAFIELFGIEEKNANGNKKDNTTKDATIAPKTDVMLTNVAGDDYAIGYVSLGSLNDQIKALVIDGAEASAENVKNGTYEIARPFNIATKGDPTDLAKDFLDFVMSAEGQEIVSDNYIAIDENAVPFAGTMPSGKIVIAGSSSVTPVMEKLAEGYKTINANAEIEVHMTDSTAGMQSVLDGTCDIGMASRDLKDSEKAELKDMAIALDGIGVIVNKNSIFNELTSEQVKSIFTGAVTNWSEI